MPIPIEGLVPIAEFGSKFDADVATNLLIDAGIEATTSYDPALNSVATYFASDRTVEVVVRADDVDRALAILAEADQGLPTAFNSPEVTTWQRSTRERRRGARSWTRLVAVGLAILFVGPFLVGIVTLAVDFLRP